MDGGRAWLQARTNFKDKVKPWDPIVFPSKPMPPRCAVSSFHHCLGAPSLKMKESFEKAKELKISHLSTSTMVGAKKARTNLLALRQYTPVGVMAKILEMETPSARLDIFQDNTYENLPEMMDRVEENIRATVKGSGWKEWSDLRQGKNLLNLEEEDEEVAEISSTAAMLIDRQVRANTASLSAVSLVERAEFRRRPASAGPMDRPGSAASIQPDLRPRPMSAHASRGASSSQRYDPIFKDPASFARLRTTLDKCPESARLFKMLKRVEAERGDQPVRQNAVIRPSSAPPSRARQPLFGVSPYAESPAAQLQTLVMPPRQPLRRPASATPGNRPGSSLGEKHFGNSATYSITSRPSNASTRSCNISHQFPANVRLSYVPPRLASAGSRMHPSHSKADSIMFSEKGWTERPDSSVTGVSSTFKSSYRPGSACMNRSQIGDLMISGDQKRRQRVAADCVRHLCTESGKCLAEFGESWETGTMCWRCHPFAYMSIPRHLTEKGDFMTLGDVLTDVHFITRRIICSGVDGLLSDIDAAVAAGTLAEQPQAAEGDVPKIGGPLRRLSRLKHFWLFLRQHAETLDKEPYRLFALGLKIDGGSEGSPYFVKYQVERSLQEAVETIESIERKYVDEEGLPNTSVRRVMILHEYLEMLLTHGCLECLSEHYSKKAHNLILSFSKFIVLHASDPDSSSLPPCLADRVLSTLVDLKTKDSPSLSQSFSLAPAACIRQLYLDISVSPEAICNSAAFADLKNVLQRDAASALGVESSDITIDRVTSTSARLICKQDIPTSKTSLGMDPSYTGPIVCFNSRPSAWDFVKVYLSADPSTSTILSRLILNTVLMALRDKFRERCVELIIVDLDDGPSHTSARLAHHVKDPIPDEGGCGDSLLLVILEAQKEVKVSQMGSIFFMEPEVGADSEEQFEESCLQLCRVLWKELASKHPTPNHAGRFSHHNSVNISSQVLEIQSILSCFVHWPSRAQVLDRMCNFVSCTPDKPTEPALANLAGAHGSGKSYILAALAHQTMFAHPDALTIYYRYNSSKEKFSDAFVSHLCWALSGVKESRPSVERLTKLLQDVALKRHIVIIADGIDHFDQALLRNSVVNQAIIGPAARVRVIYCARAPMPDTSLQAKTKASFRLQPLTSSESEEHIRKLCSELSLPLSNWMKATIGRKSRKLIIAAAKKHAGMPLYLRVTAYHIAHFCEYRTFQREPQKKKQELLEHVCSQLPGELDYLIEDRVITLLECQYGQELVRRVLEYLYYQECGLSVDEMIKMLAFHTKVSARVPGVAVMTLCQDLICAISSNLELLPSGHLCMDLKSARRAVARRYFGEYVLDESERRAVMSRCYLAQKCSDEMDSTVLEISSEKKDFNVLNEDDVSDEQTDEQEMSKALSHNRERSHDLSTERSFDNCIKDPATVINECHKGGVLCIAVANRDSGDSFVCTGGADHDVKIWDFVSPAVSGDEKFKQLRGDRDSNLQDLKDLFSSGDSGLHLHLRNYCLEAHVRAKLTGHHGSIFSLAAGKNMLVSGSADHTIRLWRLDTFQCVGTLVGHRSIVSSLQYMHPNLYSAGHDGKIRAWNVENNSCWASLDSTKRAAIHSITSMTDRLFVGIERRWNEIINPIKVWSMNLGECLNEFPSKEVQQLAADSKLNEEAIKERDKEIAKLTLESLNPSTKSIIKIQAIKDKLEQAQESRHSLESQLKPIKEKFLKCKGDVYVQDDVYCMHIEKCKLTTSRHTKDILFVGGNYKPILAWDIKKMICIEQMDGESHQADYTRCIVSDNGFLYSGGGKLKHQEKVAASSVAAKLKLEAEHSEQMQCSTGDRKHSDAENCGRVTVWCTSSLKPLGSMTFASVIMSLSIVEDKLFVGDVGGNISILALQSALSAFLAQITNQVEQSKIANAMIVSKFLSRRDKLQSSKSLHAISKTMAENIHDPALITALLMEQGRVLASGKKYDSKESQLSSIDYLLDVMGRYPTLVKFQVHAINVLSLCMREPGHAHALSHEQLKAVSAVLLNQENRDSDVLHRAGCLLFLEMLSPLSLPLEVSAMEQKKKHDLFPLTAKHDANIVTVLNSGALAALLTSIKTYGGPNAIVKNKGQMDTAVLEVAVPLLRFLAVNQPQMCRDIIEQVGTVALDTLDSHLADQKMKLDSSHHKDNAFEDLFGTLLADLTIAQGCMGIKIRGRSVPKPVVKQSSCSYLLKTLFDMPEGKVDNVGRGNTAEIESRAKNEVWSEILRAVNSLQ